MLNLTWKSLLLSGICMISVTITFNYISNYRKSLKEDEKEVELSYKISLINLIFITVIFWLIFFSQDAFLATLFLLFN